MPPHTAALAITSALLASSLAAADRSATPGFMVRVWQSEDGLPGNVARSITQTDDGFLWVATAEGIARFDGIAFEPVTPPAGEDSNRLDVARLFNHAGNHLWAATFGGGLLELQGMQLVRVLGDSPQPRTPLVTQVLDVGGTVYFQRGDSTWTATAQGPQELDQPPPEIGTLLAGDLGHQLLHGRRPAPSGQPALVDSRGGRWDITGGLLCYTAPGATPQPVAPDKLGGRAIFNEMFEDREGNIWLASPVQGLVQIRYPRVVRLGFHDSIQQRSLQTAVQGGDGTWWIAGRSGGIERIRDDKITHLELVPGGYPRPAICLFEDSHGHLWVGSRDGTVFEWTGDTFTPQFTKTGTPSKVRAITESPAGTVWFGGKQGLSNWDGTTVHTFGHIPALQRADVSTLAALPDGQILAGTTTGEIFRGDGSSFERLGNPSDLGDRWVSSVLPLADGQIWAATLGAGIHLWDDSRWVRFDSGDGLPDDRVTAVASDSDDGLWLGSLGGIIHASRSGLTRYADQPDTPPRWLRLDRSDGLASRECVGGTQPGTHTSPDGTIWFPTTGGLAGVRPGELIVRDIPPEVHFNSIRIDGQPRTLTGEAITAGPGRTRADFTFTGISLSAPEKVTYRTRLVGLDGSSEFIGTRRQVSYSSLPPGDYRFEVTAINGDGIASPVPATIPLVVRPHVWQTAWFITLATTLALATALGSGWLIARQRMRQRLLELRVTNALESERSRIARDLHDDLGASLTELSILSALATESADEASLRPALQTLSGKAKSVVSTLDEIVWSANPREDSLRSLVDYLCGFAREFLDNTRIPLRTEIERGIPELPIGPNRRHNVFLAARESINNAVKHAGATEIRLAVSTSGGNLEIRITDDGCGFSPDDPGAGDGLRNLRQRMQSCGGSFAVQSAPGRGSTVTLTLPLPTP